MLFMAKGFANLKKFCIGFPAIKNLSVERTCNYTLTDLLFETHNEDTLPHKSQISQLVNSLIS